MSPLSHRAVSAKCRHQSCKPWFHAITSTDQAARNSWSKGRRNAKNTESPCRNSRYQGRRNVFAVADCRCHNSWHKGRRNVEPVRKYTTGHQRPWCRNKTGNSADSPDEPTFRMTTILSWKRTCGFSTAFCMDRIMQVCRRTQLSVLNLQNISHGPGRVS